MKKIAKSICLLVILFMAIYFIFVHERGVGITFTKVKNECSWEFQLRQIIVTSEAKMQFFLISGTYETMHTFTFYIRDAADDSIRLVQVPYTLVRIYEGNYKPKAIMSTIHGVHCNKEILLANSCSKDSLIRWDLYLPANSIIESLDVNLTMEELRGKK